MVKVFVWRSYISCMLNSTVDIKVLIWQNNYVDWYAQNLEVLKIIIKLLSRKQHRDLLLKYLFGGEFFQGNCLSVYWYSVKYKASWKNSEKGAPVRKNTYFWELSRWLLLFKCGNLWPPVTSPVIITKNLDMSTARVFTPLSTDVDCINRIYYWFGNMVYIYHVGL